MHLIKTYPNLLAIFDLIPEWAVFVILGILAVGFPLRYGMKKFWVFIASHWLYRQLSPWISFSQARTVFQGYLPRLYSGKGGKQIPLIRFFIQEVFRVQERKTYLLLGYDGAGKTSFLLRLFATYQLQPWLRGKRILYISWSNGDCQSYLEEVHSPEHTILLLDGIDECSAAYPAYKQHMDQIFYLTRSFATVILGCRKGYLPENIEGDERATSIHYIGESCYELLEKIELPPMGMYQANKLIRQSAGRRWKREKKKSKEKIQSNPGLLQTPALLQMLPGMKESRTAIFSSDCVANWVHQEIGRITKSAREASALFDLLCQMAQQAYFQYGEGQQMLIASTRVEEAIEEKSLSMKTIHACQILDKKAEAYQFRHSLLMGYFLAWYGFHRELPIEDTHFEDFPVARNMYQELCWNRYFEEAISDGGLCRVKARVEKKAILALTQSEILQVNRLYFHPSPSIDARFLRNLEYLEAIHLLNCQPKQIPAQLIEEIPDPKILLYFPHEAGNTAFFFQEKEADLWIEEGQRMAVRARSLEKFQISSLSDPMKPLQYPGRKKPSSHRLLSLFEASLGKIDRDSSSRELPANFPDSSSFERILGRAEMDLFDRVQVVDFSDGSRNVIFFNGHIPTLMVQSLEQIVNQLYFAMGEDDDHKELFLAEDEAQIEDGHWQGRKWLWKNTDSYAHAVHLYMEQAGQVRLCVWGVEAIKDDLILV